MAKLSIILREKKRRELANKYAERVKELKAIIESSKTDDESKDSARLALQKLPRNAHKTRQRNRCFLTGRPRGVFRRFGLARNKLRELALKGDIPGITKSSW